jgi:uroporphyrinogen III methyltransferase/synthase
VLVVGDVVDLADRLAWIGRRPLQGLRVFVTRTRAQAGKLSELLREAGADPLEFPAIRIVSPTSFAALDQVIQRLDDFDWIVFASTNAVEAFWDRLFRANLDTRSLANTRVAAVGAATADALRERGVVTDLVPSTFTSAALAEAIGEATGDRRHVLIPQAEDAPSDLVDALERKGWSCDTPAAYRTERDDASVAEGRRALDEGVDAVLFTSGSTVRSFVELWGKPSDGTTICCIGPRTAEAAASLGLSVHAIAAEQSIDGLVAALVAAVRR